MSSTPNLFGKSPLHVLYQYYNEIRRAGWSGKQIERLTTRSIDAYSLRNEVRAGGVFSTGAAVTAANLNLDMTALDVTIDGKLKAQAALKNDVNMLTTAGDVGQPIFADGSDASAINLGASETAYCTVIATDSDGAGSRNDDDNDATLFVVVIAGVAATYQTQTDFLTSAQIRNALAAATAIHDGDVRWVRLAEVLWDENGGAPQVTVTLNRNNVLGY